jgi:phosphate starvation-inducible PhoH-like protein
LHIEKKFQIKGIEPLLLYGIGDAWLTRIEAEFPTSKIIARGNEITLKGETDELFKIEKVLAELMTLLNRNGELRQTDVNTVLNLANADSQSAPAKPTRDSSDDDTILATTSGVIKTRTNGQRKYIEAARRNDVVFGIGPAGTGKTYLAVALAVAALKNRDINRIVLARPAVEAGESLGFLPGDLTAKIDPYLRPLYDSLQDMLTADKLKDYLEKKTIEIVPLAYMRGRTLNNSFIILDEAQNATAVQMKMFLTRLGQKSKAVITGDTSQIDLPSKVQSGLVQIQEVLKGIEGIAFVYFTKEDVVRHRLVRDIIEAYDKFKPNGQSLNFKDDSQS